MADTFVQQTDGIGTKVHSFSRSVAGQTVAEEVWHPGLSGLITTRGAFIGVGFTTAAVGPTNIPQINGGPFWPDLIGLIRLHVPQPYYCYLTKTQVIQSGLPSGTASVLPLGIGLATNGFGEGSYFGDGFPPSPAIKCPPADTSDALTMYAASALSDLTAGPLTALSLPILLSVPLVGTGALPNARTRDRWEAGAKPLRAGPGDSVSISLWQRQAINVDTTIQWNVDLVLSID